MIFQFLDALRSANPAAGLAVLFGVVLALVLGITFHEFAHAYVATQLGDSTPRYQGRLTLNPLAHLDPIGSLMILLAGFGYGKPVQFNPLALRMDRRLGSAVVALAGPVTNIILGIAGGLSLRSFLELVNTGRTPAGWEIVVAQTLSIFVVLNFVLAIFNMVPFPPLDGSKVLQAVLPREMADSVERFYYQFGQYGMLLLFVLLFVGGRYIGPLISTPAYTLCSLIAGTPC